MSDSLTLYGTLMKFVWQNDIYIHDVRCLVTFVWAMVGLIQSQKIHLSQWQVHRVGRANAASKQRQLSRWLHNPKINPSLVYYYLIKAVLRAWTGQTLYLALDPTSLWGRFTIVRLALIYRGRAIPISWMVLRSGSTSVALRDYRTVLFQAVWVLPPGCRVILLADRGFGDIELLQLVRDLGWSFRIRLKNSIWVYRTHQAPTKVGRLMPAKGQARFFHTVWITQQWFGPVHLALAYVQTPQGYQPWAIVSDEPTDLSTLDEYGGRFDLEENFLDDKSAGFQIESSQIKDEQALARLALILATATLYLVNSGVAVVATGQRRWVDPHWHRGLSYFQLGWRWVRHALAQGKHLFSALWLEPGSDPEPVYASKKQAATPIAILSSIQLVT
jgi:hypothetical protein